MNALTEKLDKTENMIQKADFTFKAVYGIKIKVKIVCPRLACVR